MACISVAIILSTVLSANTASLAVILFSKRIQMTKLSVVCSVHMAELLLEFRSVCTRMENTAWKTRRQDLYLTETDTMEREADSSPLTHAVICSIYYSHVTPTGI